MTDYTDAERAALDAWSRVSADTAGMLFAVREAVRVVERRESKRLCFLREEIDAILGLAHRGIGSSADAIEAIHARASRALSAELDR